MIRDITIGQYYKGNSIIHRFDARLKIIATFLFIVSIFFSTNFYGYALNVLFIVIVIMASRVPILHILKGIKFIFVLISITFIFNLFSYGGDVIVKIWIFKMTTNGLIIGVKMLFRVILLIIGSSLLTYTTTPIKITEGIEQMLSPLKRIKFPAHEIAMMMSIAIRFIPILILELDKIMKAQGSRGVNFETGSIIKRLKALVPILIPILMRCFIIAEDLAIAMESRCYFGGEGRSKYKPLTWKRVDAVGFATLSVYIVCVGILRYFL